MQLLNAVQNEAIMSNVGEIGDFKIKASAKAFSILSSGLYANKIRAIVRELSCNAVDSHVAAGNPDTPFDIHLPNRLEAWFAIRDYGTGLSHEQVKSIYTTYFESTKTGSNDFIGALGLGSKSPFSYTDNFTVTAIQSGTKNIYSAFINGDGVPSVALMMSEATDEANGVEVKFGVEERWDFDKFHKEARTVFKYFKLRPNVLGADNFEFEDPEYDVKDIVPGIHSTNRGYGRSMAVMGNIAYPIEIPESDKTLEGLRSLLNCELVIEFAIGELDFQASREGLSYIPQTIASIKSKLAVLNTNLAVKLAVEADAIDNLWTRATWLVKKRDSSLWQAAVEKYVIDTKFDLINSDRTDHMFMRPKTWKFTVEDLAKTYNIRVTAFSKSRGSKSTVVDKGYNDNIKNPNATPGIHQGQYLYVAMRDVSVSDSLVFVVNDTKTGAMERAKFHWNNTPMPADGPRNHNVYVLEPADKTKPVLSAEFFAELKNPPQTMLASALLEKPRKDRSMGKNVTILVLGNRGYGGYYREREQVWKDAGKADTFDSKATFYYLPLSGFTVESKVGSSFDTKQFVTDLKECGLPNIPQTVYGVRKSDIEFIKTQSNWVNIEDFLSAELIKPVDDTLVMSLVIEQIDSHSNLQYNNTIAVAISDQLSPYLVFVNKLKGFERIRYSDVSLRRLCQRYAKGVTFSPEAQVQTYLDEYKQVQSRYPLLQFLRSAPSIELANYINMIDTQKGI